MSTEQREPDRDISSAPESGTKRNETSGNQPAHGSSAKQEKQPQHGKSSGCRHAQRRPDSPDDVSSAPESGTVR